MQTFITDKETLLDVVERAVQRAVQTHLPQAIRVGTRKKWLNSEEAQDYLNCSRRHLQYLRDSKSLRFSQSGRTIRYSVDDLDDYLVTNRVTPISDSKGNV